MRNSRSALARKLDYFSLQLLILLISLFFYTRFLPGILSILLAGVTTYFSYHFLRAQQKRYLTKLAQYRYKKTWLAETKKDIICMNTEQLVIWTTPVLQQLGLYELACPIEQTNIQLTARLGLETIAICFFSKSHSVTAENLENLAPPANAKEKILVVTSGYFTLEACNWAKSRQNKIKLLDCDQLLDLAWHLKYETAVGDNSNTIQRPATVDELRQLNKVRFTYGAQSALYLLLWSFTIPSWNRYYYLSMATFVTFLLYRYYCHYRSLVSPDWTAWLAGTDKKGGKQR